MPRLPVPSKVIRGFQYVLENDFTGGLKTEFTGLNFPENACTSTSNCTFFHTGAVFRRSGFDWETNAVTSTVDRTNKAMSSFVWTNAGGDGNTKILVSQLGTVLSFYNISTATVAAPLSSQTAIASIDFSTFQAGAASASAIECQYSAGNGYLFVYNSACNSFYCTLSAGVITPAAINIQIRDFVGIPEPGIPDTLRPIGSAYTHSHNYNLQNQGWTSTVPWSATSTSVQPLQATAGILWIQPNTSFTISGVAAGLPIVIGQLVNVNVVVTSPPSGDPAFTLHNTGATVFSYSGTTLVVTTGSNSNQNNWNAGWPLAGWGNITTVTPANPGGQITTFQGFMGFYPSNSDVWWTLKDSTGVFAASTAALHTAVANTTIGGPAPKGSYILDAFTQSRTGLSGISGLNDITTLNRPRTGTWFQGRVFYTGIDDAFVANGTAPYTTWTENIYFSQIITSPIQFGRCYQTNDPTDETLFDILPSDGGVITIQGSGSIYKLFPITNGLIVFAANGVWFITGSTGIGFTATDYTVSKISAVQSISSTSYVDVLGYPIFWNEEGIYAVTMEAQQQGLSVNSLTLNSIKQFYDAIPLQSKKFVRGSYNPITGQVQWAYRSTNETDVTSRYTFDSILNFSMFTQAFYPWQLPSGDAAIHDVTYIISPGGSSTPISAFKYLSTKFISAGVYSLTYAEERDNTNWKDWVTAGITADYTSFFVTGYRLHGDAQRKWQPGYVYIYSDNAQQTSYSIQGQWNYAISGASNKYSLLQTTQNTVNTSNFSKMYRRHRIRGRGTVLQLRLSSVSGEPFHIDGWSIWETQNAGV